MDWHAGVGLHTSNGLIPDRDTMREFPKLCETSIGGPEVTSCWAGRHLSIVGEEDLRAVLEGDSDYRLSWEVTVGDLQADCSAEHIKLADTICRVRLPSNSFVRLFEEVKQLRNLDSLALHAKVLCHDALNALQRLHNLKSIVIETECHENAQRSLAELQAAIPGTSIHWRDADQKARELIGLICELVPRYLTWTGGAAGSVYTGIAKIDAMLSKQLAAIMHSPEFQRLEGTWRGLHHLVMNAETTDNLKVKCLNVTISELREDFGTSPEFDRSCVFMQVSREFQVECGEPYGILIGDYEFTNHLDDVQLIWNISRVSAANFCPLITAVSPQFFGFEQWSELCTSRDLAKIFDTPEYVKWKSFRECETARYVVMTMPRSLARLPYGENSSAVEEFNYEELDVGGEVESNEIPTNHYCWMNTAYVLASKLTDAFTKHGFYTGTCGYENWGLVEDLPTRIVLMTDGDDDDRDLCPTDIARIPTRCKEELIELGFLPLIHSKHSGYSAFCGIQTSEKPTLYCSDESTHNRAIMVQLPNVMAVSRFAHYLKLLVRDLSGGLKETGDLREALNKWIQKYVLPNPDTGEDEKGRFPLREARIELKSSESVEAFLHPWLPSEELTCATRIVFPIPASNQHTAPEELYPSGKGCGARLAARAAKADREQAGEK